MAWSVTKLVLVMVGTGALNTLSTSWTDTIYTLDTEGNFEPFNHPFFQAVCLFLGETFCLWIYFFRYYQKYRHAKKIVTLNPPSELIETSQRPFFRWPPYNPIIFLAPACCDMLATTIMYIGVSMTYSSGYDMLRGSLIIFTGLLSVAFLGRTLRSHQWTGMLLVIVGLTVVGGADFITADDARSNKDTTSVIVGDLLIIVAQFFAATQMVLEERFLNKVKVHPLQVVGLEGCFGFTIMGILLCPMYFTYVSSTFSTNPFGRIEDVVDAFYQMVESWQICFATVVSIVAFAFYSFAGVSVTKEISATTRTVLDTLSTMFVYVISLGLGWEVFQYLQIIGYLVMGCGMLIYNDVIIVPFMRRRCWLPTCCDPLPETANEQPLAIDNEEAVDASGVNLANEELTISNVEATVVSLANEELTTDLSIEKVT